MAKDVLQNAPVVGLKKRFPRSFGRYILEKSLSRGGMGEVYLAVAKGVNQRCVIKTIRGDLTGEEEFIGRFADEAKIMVRIIHQNIIRVFDAGKVDHDYYIAMEFVHGRDLGDVLDRAYERAEPIPMQLGLFVSAELLKGLQYAHALTDEHGRRMGLVHRDISPQNILVGFDGSVKLIDFGLARTDVLPARTQGALAVGKYGYMSPEQARHERIDGRADIYSAGVMLFEVFTGDRLVDEQEQATLWQRVLSPKHRPPRAVLPSLPKEIDHLIMSSVAVKPEDRFPDADAMLQFVQSMRTKDSGRDAFVRYLRNLYPKVDFSPPALPKFEDPIVGGTEQSIIIATSREGALSVFGRGDLPIEWTMQIDAADVRAHLKAPPADRKRELERIVADAKVTESMEAASPDAFMDETHIRSSDVPITKPATLDAPTQIAPFPDARDPADETRYTRPPPGDDLRIPSGLENTVESAPALGASPVHQAYGDDDEMTVMMSAPIGELKGKVPAGADIGDAPTRLSRVLDKDEPDPMPSVMTGAPGSRGNRREIKEKNTFGDSRTQTPASDPRVQQRTRPMIVHRATVRSEAADPDRGPERPARRTSEPEMTVSERPQIGLMLPGMILFGVAILIVALVIFLLR